MAVTFDGINLLIILDDTDLIVDVEQDLYSAWKNWQLLSDNLKYPPAFRSVGGDPLTPGIDLGATFFLNNEDGWRIKPDESDQTYLVTGNLAPENSLLPLTTPTDGGFTVLINGLQPVTQNVDLLLEQQQNAAYEGAVHINTISGSPGTTFPIGTKSNPVSNLADATTILAERGFSAIGLTGVITLVSAFPFFKIFGESGVTNIDVNGQDVGGTLFERLGIFGDFSGTSQFNPTALYQCTVTAPITDFVGNMGECLIGANISLQAGQTNLARCVSNVPGSMFPVIDFQGNVSDLSNRGYVGGVSLTNVTSASSDISCDLDGARLTLDSTITAGNFVVGGVGTLTDNSTNVTSLSKNGFVDGLDVKLIKALDAGNITITGASPFVVTVLDPDDNITVLGTWEVTADGKTRTRTS